MNKDEKSTGTDNRKELPGGDVEVIDHGPATKEFRPKYVDISVKITDAHYIATFGQGPNRVFHNKEELLVAIEVEVDRLKP